MLLGTLSIVVKYCSGLFVDLASNSSDRHQPQMTTGVNHSQPPLTQDELGKATQVPVFNITAGETQDEASSTVTKVPKKNNADKVNQSMQEFYSAPQYRENLLKGCGQVCNTG